MASVRLGAHGDQDRERREKPDDEQQFYKEGSLKRYQPLVRTGKEKNPSGDGSFLVAGARLELATKGL